MLTEIRLTPLIWNVSSKSFDVSYCGRNIISTSLWVMALHVKTPLEPLKYFTALLVSVYEIPFLATCRITRIIDGIFNKSSTSLWLKFGVESLYGFTAFPVLKRKDFTVQTVNPVISTYLTKWISPLPGLWANKDFLPVYFSEKAKLCNGVVWRGLT